MSNVYALAAELARPVARGDLSLACAHAAIAVAAAREPGRDVSEIIPLASHVFALNLRSLESRRALATAAVARALRPLIAARAAKARLLAEAYDVNADHGWLLTDAEVEGVAAVEVSWAMRQGKHHGR